MKKSLLLSVLLSPLLSLSVSLAAQAEQTAQALQWEKNLDVAIQASKKNQQRILVDFYAQWCAPCKKMEKVTYADPRVLQQLKNYLPVKIDIDQQQATAQKYDGNPLKYKGKGIPATMILDASGKVLAQARGYLSAEQLLALLASVKN